MSEPTFDDNPRPNRLAELEERIRKLETALAERPSVDDEIIDRVIARLSAIAAGRERHPDEGVLVLAEPHPDVPPPPGAVLHPPAAPVDSTEHKWFLPHLWAEIRLAAQMYFDPRYRVSRTTQFTLPGIALLLIFNYFLFGVWMNITFLSPLVERLLIVMLAIVAYKLFTRELARYREVREYLARYGPR